ncbi:reverse transcriptase [Plakobranchus ocellatus]|uniref:Reverse transcriptase n=1 Tax=Plakobranchus ocellatus TaxID=259542 RepID=A0AAV4BGB9_9GAST|nr:reverse transcriptase [Plakobranchus ocellatus]
MVEDSEDPAVRSIQPQLGAGRKWKVDEAVDETKEGLKMKEAIGLTQTGRKGLGSGGIKRVANMDTQRKSLLVGCVDWEFSTDLQERNKHSKVIQDTGMRPDILFHVSATRQTIMAELTAPCQSRMG